jgi:hypothetical protein
VHLDRCCDSFGSHAADNTLGLGKDLAWRQPSAGRCEGSGAKAA